MVARAKNKDFVAIFTRQPRSAAEYTSDYVVVVVLAS